jgi:hypothetical protein
VSRTELRAANRLVELNRPWVACSRISDAGLPPLAADGTRGRLLFPSPWSDREQPIQDIRGLLDRVARRAGLGSGSLRTKMFRHT